VIDRAELPIDTESANGGIGTGRGERGRLRICHLGKFYPPASGGIETHLQTLARAQSQLGLDVTVLCVNHRDARGRDVTWKALTPTPTVSERDGDVRVIRLGRRASLARLDLCPDLPAILSSLGSEQYDLLHLHVPNPTMLLGLSMCRPRVPWVIGYHSDVVRQRTLMRLQRPFENAVFRRARAILAASPDYQRGSSYLQRFVDRVTVIPYGIDLDAYLQPVAAAQHYASELRREHGEPLWLAVGRLVYYKGLDNVVRALTRVRGRLLIVGDGPLRGELRALARAEGVAERIVWRARLEPDELIGAYHAATALWFPSNARSEAFGLVQVEAMACGRPVLNSAIPGSGVAWVSPDGETGVTVPVNDWPGLASAANRLWHDADLRMRLGARGRQRAIQQFGASAMARRTLSVYRQIIRQAGSRCEYASCT
jgi:rhamnosyl/mannosyltransferase